MKKVIALSVGMSLLALTACKKEVDTPEGLGKKANSFNELKPSEAFNWSTGKEVQVTLSGYNTSRNGMGMLKIYGEDNAIYFQGSHQNDQTFMGKIVVPAHVMSVRMSYGITEKTLDITGNQVINSLVPNIIDEN